MCAAQEEGAGGMSHVEQERHRGTGDLYQSGKVVCKGIKYDVRVFQEMHEVRGFGTGSSQVPGLKEIRGHFTETDGGFHFPSLMTSDGPLTLHLQDGRRWDCFLSNSDGTAVNQGDGIYTPAA